MLTLQGVVILSPPSLGGVRRQVLPDPGEALTGIIPHLLHYSALRSSTRARTSWALLHPGSPGGAEPRTARDLHVRHLHVRPQERERERENVMCGLTCRRGCGGPVGAGAARAACCAPTAGAPAPSAPATAPGPGPPLPAVPGPRGCVPPGVPPASCSSSNVLAPRTLPRQVRFPMTRPDAAPDAGVACLLRGLVGPALHEAA